MRLIEPFGGFTTVGELTAAAKAKPGELKFGSTGMGTGTHLGVEKFNLAADIWAVHMPAGPADAIADVIAKIELSTWPRPSSVQHDPSRQGPRPHARNSTFA